MWLIILVIVLAAVGGFLGDLLEFAAWLIAVMAIFFAAVGAALYLAYRKFVGR